MGNCNSEIFGNLTNESSIDSKFDYNGYVNGGFAILFFLVGLPWNGLVIGIILKKKLFTRPTYMLMLNLAVANLLVCVLVLPLTVVTGFGGEDVFGSRQVNDKVCLTAVFLILFPYVSTHTVALLAIDRLIYIKKPHNYKSIVTPMRMVVAIVVVWALSIVLSIPPLAMGPGTLLRYVPEAHVCMLVFEFLEYLIPILVESALVVILQCVMCAWMLCIARKQMKKRFLRNMAEVAASSKRTSHQSMEETTSRNRKTKGEVQREYNKSQLHLVKAFMVLFTASSATFLLCIAFSVVIPVCGQLPAPLYPIAYLLYLSRAIVQPILEAVTAKEIRGVLASCVRMQWRRKHEDLSIMSDRTQLMQD